MTLSLVSILPVFRSSRTSFSEITDVLKRITISLQLEDIAIDEFLENDNNFIRGIEKIYCKVIYF